MFSRSGERSRSNLSDSAVVDASYHRIPKGFPRAEHGMRSVAAVVAVRLVMVAL